MFRLSFCCGKNSTRVIELIPEEKRIKSSSEESVTIPDTPLPSSDNKKKTPWFYRTFARLFKKQQSDVNPEAQTKSTRKKTRKLPLLLKNRRVGQAPPMKIPTLWGGQDKVETFFLEEEQKTPQEDGVNEAVSLKKNQPGVSTVQQQQVRCQDDGVTKVVSVKKNQPGVSTVQKKQVRCKDDGVTEVVEPKKDQPGVSTVLQQQIRCLGFPNPAQFCYIISCLQSLLTMEDFVKAVTSQQELWNLVQEADVMRSFMNIIQSHRSSDMSLKVQLLIQFKKAVSTWAPEFEDHHQKDAHEFLISVLQQMRFMSPQLQVTAASMDTSYSCPVEDNVVFKMLKTRTCNSCEAGSVRQEEFTNLSLDLLPGGGTVEEMLESYLSASELEYRCECTNNISCQRYNFNTLPKVLILHLKRFRYTPRYQLEKVTDPVTLSRDLLVSCSNGGACFSLVSVISHMGRTPQSGHYICDGVDPDVSQHDPRDRWLTYNDAHVISTDGASVCQRRKRNAYILFYKRQE